MASSRKGLMQEYHRLAADTLLGGGSDKTAEAVLQAAESGQVDRLKKLLSEHRSLVDTHHPDTGDTPLITAARNGHKEVVDILLGYGADVTLENDCRDSVLDVAGDKLRVHILKSIGHEDRSMTNAKALLQSAWLGDAVSVERCLSGSHYLNVNCRNRDSLTPLLLVTKDVSLFTEVQTAMETDYNPLEVVEQLLAHHADVNKSDQFGRSPLHLIASSSPSIHATKMVSLLLQNGSCVDAQDGSSHSPLHVASAHGHVAVIVALVEEGGADVNVQTGDTGDTPLMLSVRGGHNEAARYLLSQGADVTIVADNGDSALSVANSPRIRRMIREAWSEQSEQVAKTTRSNNGETSLSPERQGNTSFFLTDRQISRSLDFEEAELTPRVKEKLNESGSTPTLPLNGRQWSREDGEEVVFETRERNIPEERERVREERGKGTLRVRKSSESMTEGQAGVMVKAVQREAGYVPGDGTEARPPLASSIQSTATPPHQPLERLGTEAQGSQQVVKKGKSGPKRQKSKSVSKPLSHKGPSQQLLTQRSLEATTDRRNSYDSRVTNDRSHDSHMIRSSMSKKEQLPKVFSFSSAPSPKPVAKSSYHHDNKLPNINLQNMKPVAVVAVDTQADNLRVRGFGETSRPNHGNMSPMSRSRSLMAVRGSRPNVKKKRKSTGSIEVPPQLSNAAVRNTGKSVLPPRTVSLQFGGLPPPPPTAPHNHPPQPHRGVPPARTSHPNLTPALSIVNEDSESLASTQSLLPATKSDQSVLSPQLPSSEESTLKASSQSDFETDSLERYNNTPQVPLTTSSLLQQYPAPSTHSSTLHSVYNPLPATISQFLELSRQMSTASHAPSSNDVIHYAVQEGSTSLSPIWNQQDQLSLSHSEDGTASEFITSFVGACAEAPRPVNPGTPVPGLDSGQGESTDEEKAETSSVSSASDTEQQASVDVHCLKWKKGRLLGKGAYGKVWEGLLDSAQMIAVKEVELDIVGQRAQSQYEKLRIEVEILRSLRHRNVVRYLGTSMDDCMVYIFMEFVSGGSLQSVLKRFGPLDDKTNSHYTKQIVRALHYLHSNGIVHRDIKGANVMVTSQGVVKLIDFGCAKQSCQDISGEMRSVRGTPYWMAPEVIRGEGYGRKSDIWSLGCTVHEMAVSKPPWADHPPEAAIFQIGVGRPIPQLPKYLSEEVTAFIQRCVVKDQLKRPGANELLEDPFITKFKKKR